MVGDDVDNGDSDDDDDGDSDDDDNDDDDDDDCNSVGVTKLTHPTRSAQKNK